MTIGYQISFIVPSKNERESIVFHDLSIAMSVLRHFTIDGLEPHLTLYGNLND